MSLAILNEQIIQCERCPELRAYCAQVAKEKRKQWREWTYWGRPVPSFGDVKARVLVVGLAPGAHGSNRTGRPFTGDGSGDFMYPVLYEAGFASQPMATSREDGLKLRGMWITSVGRCAPPANKPTPQQLRNCAPWLDEEIAALPTARVIVCLGKIGFDGVVAHLKRVGVVDKKAKFAFAHGAEYQLPDGRWLMATYHPSLQNTNTGVLTKVMFLRVFMRARELAGLDS